MTVEYTSYERIDGWLEAYRLKQKFRVPPVEGDTILSNPTVGIVYSTTKSGLIFSRRRK